MTTNASDTQAAYESWHDRLPIDTESDVPCTGC